MVINRQIDAHTYIDPPSSVKIMIIVNDTIGMN